MGLDLDLLAIPGKAKYVFQKAFDNLEYARDFDKITEPENIKRHLQMVKANPDGTSIEILNELLKDSENVVQYYPDKNSKKYRFYSETRGYDTLNYLLKKFLENNPGQFTPFDEHHIFHSGLDINSGLQEHVRFQYWNSKLVSDFYKFIAPILFEKLLEYYDYEAMQEEVYKLTTKENLPYLKEEFEELKEFYKKGVEIEGFVIIKVV